REYFLNFQARNSDTLVDLATGDRTLLKSYCPPWKVALIDTGLNTMTGGRIRRLRDYLGDAPFMVTYGDGVADVNLTELLEFHRGHGKLATVTAVRPPARFGALQIDEGQVSGFCEKPQTGEGWINGGFFVFEPAVLDYIASDETVL